MDSFSDHFSDRSEEYARYRPDYPPELFDFLARAAPDRSLAWDCATGSGQAAAGVARHFESVLATDASLRQVRSAAPHPRVRYMVATAEDAPVRDAAAALVTSAQALHWFDRARFWAEVRRVLTPGGIIAVWSYHGFHVTPEVEEVVNRYYRDIVGPYWPAERAIVERGYASLEFPFEAVPHPDFVLEKRWDLSAVTGYLRTWSATQRYEAALGEDPIALIREDLAAAWGPPGTIRGFRWDLDLKVGRKEM